MSRFLVMAAIALFIAPQFSIADGVDQAKIYANVSYRCTAMETPTSTMNVKIYWQAIGNSAPFAYVWLDHRAGQDVSSPSTVISGMSTRISKGAKETFRLQDGQFSLTVSKVQADRSAAALFVGNEYNCIQD